MNNKQEYPWPEKGDQLFTSGQDWWHNACLNYLHQGCTVLKNADIIENIMKVHTVVKKSKADIMDLVFTQNIKGKAAQFGKDMRISADTRFIFTEGDIANVMISILNAPMIADSLTKFLGAQNRG